MDIFDKLKTMASDHGALWDAFQSSEQEAQDIITAVAERIVKDKETHAAQVERLTAQSKDSTRPKVIRRLAVQELERLKDRKFGPSEDEISVFNSAMRDAESAIDDLRKLQGQLRGLFEEATATLKKTQAETVGSGARDPGLARNWIEGDRRRFEALCQEAGT